MPDHVLGHLARRFTVSEENLATEALTWILRDPLANSALCSLVRGAGTALPDGLTFIGQVGNLETGRPDIVGLDVKQTERLLIEAKFAAGLTERQPAGYLSRLPDDNAGMLLVVAPSARINTLWAKLLRAVPQLDDQAPSPSAQAGTAVRTAPVAARTTLALTSWRHLVTHLLEAVKTAGNVALAQDVEQLLALTEVMDSQAYAPVIPGDYGTNEARRVQQLEALIDSAHRLVKKSQKVEHEGRSSHGRIFYGWYLRSRTTKKSLWFGFLPRVWAEKGISPLWMQIKVSKSWSRHRLAQALAPLHGQGQAGVFELGENFYVPLMLEPYLSQDQTIKDLVRQVEALVDLLDAAVPAGETPVPDAIGASDDESDSDASEAAPG